MNVDDLLDDILRREGGYSDRPNDRGGPTNFGITQRAWIEYRQSRFMPDSLPAHVRDITSQQARGFYRAAHVQPWAWVGDQLAALLIDSAINHGPTRVVRWLQLAAGVSPDGIIGPATRAAVRSNESEVYREVLRTRFKFYAQIASDQLNRPGGDPDAEFLRGWINRACEFIR